jgi:hypothetical protein
MTYPTHDTYLTQDKTTNVPTATTSLGNALGKETIEMLLPLLTSPENPLAELLGVILNAAMKIERQQFLGKGTNLWLGVEPHQRSQERNGQANGFKERTLATRLA